MARAPDGWRSVEDFMAAALFDPATGYYAARVREVGRTGDFSTGATLHPALGQALARWAWARRAEVMAGWRRRWHVVELGPGGGQLAESFLRALGPWRRAGLTLHLVEVSAGLRAAQRERLRPWAGRVRWHADVAAALRAAAGGRALVFSNEFVDAFPCRVWERREGRWREVGLVRPGGSTVPVERLAATEPPADLSGVFGEHALSRLAEGQRVETHGRYRNFLARELAPGWRAGRLLTIDYGDELPAPLPPPAAGDAARAYFRHQVLTGPEVYARAGHQDLTADVNFSDLRRWGRELGFRRGRAGVADAGGVPAPLVAGRGGPAGGRWTPRSASCWTRTGRAGRSACSSRWREKIEKVGCPRRVPVPQLRPAWTCRPPLTPR